MKIIVEIDEEDYKYYCNLGYMYKLNGIITIYDYFVRATKLDEVLQ